MLNYIGRTPTIRLTEIEKHFALLSPVYAKAELLNPAGSIKDRVAAAMIYDAEKSGVIRPVGLVTEPTSGNTGIALAMICAIRGYKLKIVMPKGASVEREMLMKAYGAEVIRTSGGMSEAIKAAKYIVTSEGAFMPDQFKNPVCAECHYRSTAVELLGDMQGEVGVFICGVGTGATLMGVGRYLKERSSARIIAVEPSESAVLSGKASALHGIEGIGAGFIPPLYDKSIVDEVITVSTDEAKEMTRILAKKEGIFSGISSGANLAAAIRVAKTAVGNIVFPICDRGERYFSRGVF